MCVHYLVVCVLVFEKVTHGLMRSACFLNPSGHYLDENPILIPIERVLMGTLMNCLFGSVIFNHSGFKERYSHFL